MFDLILLIILIIFIISLILFISNKYYTINNINYTVSCKWRRWGCCSDNITPKLDIFGSNCRGF